MRRAPWSRTTRDEARLALALAFLAGLRVLLFALAFPFFSNVDEMRHVDAVLKYARGHRPAPGLEPYEPEMARLLGVIGSPEYHRDPAAPLRRELPPPVWASPPEEAARRVAAMEAFLGARRSLEADQPPVYYASAGAWLLLGRALGLRDGALLYWVRTLPALGICALVFASWWVLREVYPAARGDAALLRLGVPLLLAVLPQDALYYVTGDAMSPLLGGLAFLLLVRLLLRPEATKGAYLGAGLALAATFLCKYPNAALFAAAAVVTAAALAGPASGRARVEGFSWLWAAALLPAAAWLLRNALLGGDLTGTALKVEHLGWGRKPVAQWLDHPLLSPGGLWIFLRDLVPTFWRGELAWYRRDLAWGGADLVYRVSTLVLLPLAAWGLLRAGRSRTARFAEAAALAALLAAVGMLGLLSLVFVFHETSSPSLDYPFFVQGRLIGGVLLPFALLWVRGLDEGARLVSPRAPAPVAWGVLGAVAALALVSELVLTLPVFSSPYNAYHLP